MPGSGPGLGGLPIGLDLAGDVAERGRSQHHAVGGGQHGLGERLGRIDPMAVHADVEIAAVDTLD